MSFKGIQGNDVVMYSDRVGQVRRGKASPMLIFPSHVVIDAGGKHGRPQVVNESNYVRHAPAAGRQA